MPTSWNKIRDDIKQQPCEKCGERVKEPTGDSEVVLTFFRGRFILLHQECADFIDHATKGKRQKV